MDEAHLYAAIRYIERNPVRAKIVEKAADYPWSSAQAHINKADSELLDKFYLLDVIEDWKAYLNETDKEEDIQSIRLNSQTGRPAGSKDFLREMEKISGRMLAKKKSGPRTKN